MAGEAEREYRSRALSCGFALMTVKLEDAASLAAEGQGPQADDQLLVHAQQIADLASEAATVASLLAVLLNFDNQDRG